MRVHSLLLLIGFFSAVGVIGSPEAETGQEDAAGEGEAQQQQQGPKSRMAPEAQRITLESVSADCFESVYAVLNGEAEQSSLSEQCVKELNEGYTKSPLGALQQREQQAIQTAAVVRMTPACREELIRASQPKEGEEAQQPSEDCVLDFQKHFRDMQQWISAATLSRLSKECRKEAETGNIGAECEQEFVAVKPQIIQTLDAQSEQKAKEKPKEAKKKNTTSSSSQQKPKRVKQEPPLIDPGFLFLVFWTTAIAGLIGYTCVNYYKNPPAIVQPVVEEAPQKSKTQLKKEARNRGRGIRS